MLEKNNKTLFAKVFSFFPRGGSIFEHFGNPGANDEAVVVVVCDVVIIVVDIRKILFVEILEQNKAMDSKSFELLKKRRYF